MSPRFQPRRLPNVIVLHLYSYSVRHLLILLWRGADIRESDTCEPFFGAPVRRSDLKCDPYIATSDSIGICFEVEGFCAFALGSFGKKASAFLIAIFFACTRNKRESFRVVLRKIAISRKRTRNSLMSNVARNRPQPQERSVTLASPTSMPTAVQQSLTAAARLLQWFSYACTSSWKDTVKST